MSSILIKNATIVTQNKKRDIIPHGFIVVKNSYISKVKKDNPSSLDLQGINKIIDAKGLIIFPGFINAHVHLGESIFQSALKNLNSLEEYLDITNKISKKADFIEKNRKIIANYSILNLLRSGTTTICGGRTINQASCWGIRNVSGYIVMNSFKLSKLSHNLEKKYKEEYKKIKSEKKSYPAIFIHSINNFDLKVLPIIKKLLKNYPDTRLILHLAETKKQEGEIKKIFKLSSVEFLEKNGLLNKNTILIHCNWINEKDITLIKKNKTSIVQCLSSNINIADKVLNLKKIIKTGIKSCLATDGSPTSETFNVADEAKKCFYYYKKKLTEQKCIDLITIDAARVLGLEKDIGSIEKNKKADLIFLKNNNISFINNNYCVNGVIIDGLIKLWNNKVMGFNEKNINKNFIKLSDKIKKYEYLYHKK
jgi:5-methylthioadenosine/S-adenosylhomocysteine deaminase